MAHDADIVVVGAGAAGLFASVWAARTLAAAGSGARGGALARVIAVDGASKLGAKILVAGGGRCNVTHHSVDESAYAGSTRPAIRKVLRAFSVERTVEFFASRGVELKREETGKLFPTTDRAGDVLHALLGAAREAGVEIRHPWRVGRVVRESGDTRGGFGFIIEREDEAASLRARRVILAMGGKSLPKTGSDGSGFEVARSLGHSITPHTFPALVPMLLEKGDPLTELSGITVRAGVTLRAGTGKKLVTFVNSVLFTHFGLSGPGVLDISRYWTATRLGAGGAVFGNDRPDPEARLEMNLIPDETFESLDALLLRAAETGSDLGVARWLGNEFNIPERLARVLATQTGVEPGARVRSLSREARRAVTRSMTEHPLRVIGDRGYLFAEATAGGVPLSEIDLPTMESRIMPGLHLCGEMCDVDGRIGGFNFQWAWSSGHVAGVGAARGIASAPEAN
ncbi:MAG: NAD(P)/FAD-dependent oxidoreductase [Phycisphaerales bacterium]